MIEPVALLVLEENATVTTPHGDVSPESLAVAELGEHGSGTLRARVSTGTVYVDTEDVEQCVDLTDMEFRPLDIEDLE